jgi:hypothetical protein
VLAGPKFKRRSANDIRIKRATLASTSLDLAILPASSSASIASLPVHNQNVEPVTTLKTSLGSMAYFYYTTRPTGCLKGTVPPCPPFALRGDTRTGLSKLLLFAHMTDPEQFVRCERRHHDRRPGHRALILHQLPLSVGI